MKKIRKTAGYWKVNTCIYNCEYKPKTTHDYEVHIVTKHPGKIAYPGSPDLEKYGLLRHHENRSKRNFADVADENESSNAMLDLESKN